MYILCFRMRSLMEVPRLKVKLIKMLMELIWKHKLNPLKVRNNLESCHGFCSKQNVRL